MHEKDKIALEFWFLALAFDSSGIMKLNSSTKNKVYIQIDFFHKDKINKKY